jgi:outer membrane protein TolC
VPPGAKEGAGLDEATRAKIRKLQLERRDVLQKAVQSREQEYQAGRATLDDLLKLSRRLLGAELELAATARQRLEAHAAHLKRAKEAEKLTATRYEAGRASFVDHSLSRAARLQAEVGWLKAGGKDNEKGKGR